MADKRNFIIRKSNHKDAIESFRSSGQLMELSANSCSGIIEIENPTNYMKNDIANMMSNKRTRIVREENKYSNNKHYNHNENVNQSKGIIKMAKDSKRNAKNSYSIIGYSNKEFTSPQTYSQKSSFMNTSLQKYLNILRNQTNDVKPKNLNVVFKKSNDGSYNILNYSEKKTTLTNRTNSHRYNYKSKLTQRAYSDNKSVFNYTTKPGNFSILSGERLYKRGMESLERSKINIKLIKFHKSKEEMKECTFQPKLFYSTEFLKKNILYRKNLISHETNLKNFRSQDELLDDSVNTRNNFENISTIGQRDVQKRNLKASRNSESKEVTRIKSADALRVKKPEEYLIKLGNRLYNHAEKSKLYINKLSEEYFSERYTFHPKLIKNNEKPDIMNFFHRLQAWVDKRNDKYMDDIERAKYDEKTGLRFFSPQIRRIKITNEVKYFLM